MLVTFVAAGHYTVERSDVSFVKGAALTASRPVVGDGSAEQVAAGRSLTSGTINPSIWGNRAYLEVRSTDSGLLMQIVPFDSEAARNDGLVNIGAATDPDTIYVLSDGTVTTTPVS